MLSLILTKLLHTRWHDFHFIEEQIGPEKLKEFSSSTQVIWHTLLPQLIQNLVEMHVEEMKRDIWERYDSEERRTLLDTYCKTVQSRQTSVIWHLSFSLVWQMRIFFRITSAFIMQSLFTIFSTYFGFRNESHAMYNKKNDITAYIHKGQKAINT